jgi:predicted ArsR family transcriptional regulator
VGDDEDVVAVPELQIQARALGDPTRYGVFSYVADAGAPVDVAELTAHFGLNHNAIRQHLAKLVDAELLVETAAAPTGRGRPRLIYALDPSAESRWGVTGPYERLAMLLTEVVRSGDTPEQVGRRAGLRQRLGHRAASNEPAAAFADVMGRQGFDPVLTQRGDDIEVTLQTCPFASAVLTDPDTVCELHLGLARGIAESVGGLEVDELIPKDPRRAQCKLRCRLTEDQSAAS